MAASDTNKSTLRYVVETAIGTPDTSGWRLLEPNDIGDVGVALTTTPRRPIATSRGRRKGAVTDQDSRANWDADLTIDAFTDFAEGFFYSEFANKEFDLRASSGSVPPPAVTSGGVFTIDAASATLAAKMVYAATGARTLVYSKGYVNSVNNGLHVLAADVGLTDTSVDVATAVVDETPPTKASLQVAGVQIDTGDVTFTKSGSTATLVSAAHVADWSVLGLFPGMYIHIGSNDGTGAVQNALDDSGTDDNFGFARIVSISSATMNLDKLDENLTATDVNTGVLDIMFGRFLRNVDVGNSSTDDEYLNRTYHIEVKYADLDGAGTDVYEYIKGCTPNELTMELPETALATCSWNFVSTDSDDLTASRKTGASSAVSPLRTSAFATVSNIASITTDLISLASNICFQSITMNLRNSVDPEKCLGQLAASSLPAGSFEVDLNGDLLFTDKAIVNAIKNNTTVTMAYIMLNDDGAIALDVPSGTLDGGGRTFERDKTIKASLTLQSFTDTTYGHDVGVTVFPSVPTTRP